MAHEKSGAGTPETTESDGDSETVDATEPTDDHPEFPYDPAEVGDAGTALVAKFPHSYDRDPTPLEVEQRKAAALERIGTNVSYLGDLAVMAALGYALGLAVGNVIDWVLGR